MYMGFEVTTSLSKCTLKQGFSALFEQFFVNIQWFLRDDFNVNG